MEFSRLNDLINQATITWLYQNIESSQTNYHSNTYTTYKIDAEELVVFKIKVNVSYKAQSIGIPIKLSSGTEIGTIFLAQKSIQEEAMNEFLYAAFLEDVNSEEAIINKQFKLDNTYFVIQKVHFNDYCTQYKHSSLLWGGFYHVEDEKINIPLPQIKNEIICLPQLKFPTDFHLDNAQRAILQPFAFERFLKNYHLLELQYDVIVVNKIKSLNNNIYGASKILKEYNKGEDIHRLVDTISLNFDTAKIEPLLNAVHNFRTTAIEVFYTYGKPDNNPLITSKEDFDNPDKFHRILDNGGFSASAVKSHNNTKPEDYKKFLIKLTAYWIYRIRSSIAHSKIGEFLLTSSEPAHEEFMVKFAEPLLQEVLIQCFENR